MIKNVLIKYSLIFITIFFFTYCQKKTNAKIQSDKKELINLNTKTLTIVKETDTILVIRKYGDYKNKMIDSVFLKIRNKKVFLKIPLISTYEIGMKKDIPKNKEYNYSIDDFLITATYRDFQIQYKFDYKHFKLKNIYMIENIDEIYPDFNRKATDSIAKIDVLVVNPSTDLQDYLNTFENNVYNQNVKPDETFYILRKENLKEIL